MKKKFITFCICFMFIIGFASISEAASQRRQTRRWANPKVIKTYIPPKHRHTPMMKRAFAEWSRKTNNRIIFRYVSVNTGADITVRYYKEIGECGETGIAIGCTRSSLYNCTKSECKFKHVYIDIADETVDGRELSTKVEIYTTMLHEIGHAIGLDHNENNKYSIMSVNPNRSVLKQEIGKEDLAELARIYGWK